ncbi:hypothetical protein TELCIR_13074 [Teladorsagia circumcincta]|uniref:G-protein coupled receptors family 1 profile domain-containing protein n=1 Tax=Teladorsagia circumcincta TaxID=45464 RepID=A0A2G9U510_TELCI|nr:hypothetical protein TELCIR_13074 [Teladorsagia circumcincta]
MYIILAELLGFMTIVLAATSVVNIISVVLLVIRSKRHRGDRAERNMFILALLDFLIQVTYYILYVIIYDRAGVDGTADALVPYASDLLTFSNAYLLIILNKKIRQRVLRHVKCCGATVRPSSLQVIPSVALVTNPRQSC